MEEFALPVSYIGIPGLRSWCGRECEWLRAGAGSEQVEVSKLKIVIQVNLNRVDEMIMDAFTQLVSRILIFTNKFSVQ